jgi:hypothetical protein
MPTPDPTPALTLATMTEIERTIWAAAFAAESHSHFTETPDIGEDDDYASWDARANEHALEFAYETVERYRQAIAAESPTTTSTDSPRAERPSEPMTPCRPGEESAPGLSVADCDALLDRAGVPACDSLGHRLRLGLGLERLGELHAAGLDREDASGRTIVQQAAAILRSIVRRVPYQAPELHPELWAGVAEVADRLDPPAPPSDDEGIPF